MSPKLHALLCHAPDSIRVLAGFYGEKGNEAWHGHMNLHAEEYVAASELESAALYPPAMELVQDASDAQRLPHTLRAPAASGARRATKSRDGRLREKQAAGPDGESTQDEAAREGKKWAASRCEEADEIASTILDRIAGL